MQGGLEHNTVQNNTLATKKGNKKQLFIIIKVYTTHLQKFDPTNKKIVSYLVTNGKFE